MGKSKARVGAEELAALTDALSKAIEFKEGLGADATPETIAEADKAIETAQAALDAFEAEGAPAKTAKIKFLLSPSGRFNLGYHEGEECEIEAKQADELIELGYAKLVK